MKHDTDELVFLPLGGSGEIGMNLNAYGFGPAEARQWVIVDIGVTFGGPTTPGIDLILPDPSFLEEEDVLAIVLTHAHEDHIGAIAWLWPRFKVPIYATPFTAALVREKLKERGLEKQAKITIVELGGRIEIGPFDMRLITLTHSIPEPNGILITTALGTIWHTGDWKIDPDPLVGEKTDEVAVRALGDAGLLAMVCDSTNVFVEGVSGSEAGVRESLIELVKSKRGKVAITAFASNVARVETAMHAAMASGRSVCLVGRSMHKIVRAAHSVGLLQDLPPLLSEEQAGDCAPHEVLYLCTGSQGETRAALSRIAGGTHRSVSLGKRDCVIFSSRLIPGNEQAIYALYNDLAVRGVEVITDRDAHVHVSGHPAREELKQMYQWARPRIAIPVHGERRHILEHLELAKALQTPEGIAPRNGDMIRLAPGLAQVIDEVPAGRLYVDGSALIEAEDEALLDRQRIAAEGAITISIAVSAKKRAIVSGPEVRARGLSSADSEAYETALDALADAAEEAYLKLDAATRADEDAAEAAIVRAVRRVGERLFGKRPLVDATILTV